MALASVSDLSFAYPGSIPAVRDISLELEAGEIVALLGPSGSGKSTLLRALAGLVPHFHGGTFSGRVVVAGLDTRTSGPADLAGTVASVFQDPEDQIVMTRVENEVAFGLENLGVPPEQIWPRTHAALAQVGAGHLAERRTVELSGGELQRVCLASALALEPQLLLLDEPTSQLDAEGADAFLAHVEQARCAVVLSEQRVDRALAIADRVIMMEEGRIVLDAPVAEARGWLSTRRPRYGGGAVPDDPSPSVPGGQPLVRLDDVHFAYGGGPEVLGGASLVVHRGEIVALEGRNGSGKTTLARIAAGLVQPTSGTVARDGRATYLSQDPGRHLVRETALDEVALGVNGDQVRAAAALERFGLTFATSRHPRDLSSGERERLGIAAISVSEPDLLVLDEPTRGIDPDRKAALSEWLLEQAASGRAVLVATHDPLLPAHRRVRLGQPLEVPVAV
ncbi:MAG: energy-coupling factor ABC transporter ATP-binding protein [Thermoleophilia bacterium]|nr:energy-coupling factor ABC transporter ATP-binding protein [Thermoleophilia bacterium]